MEISRNMALALFGILIVCAAAFIFLGAPSDADWAIPILGGGKGVDYELHPSSGIDQSVYGVGENGTLLEEISIEEQYLLEEGSQEPFDYQSQPHFESQESISFGGEGPEEPPVEDLCKMLGLASENCQDDNETVRLQDLDGEELSFQPVYFSPDLSHQAKSSAESSIRRKLVLSNVSETELTDLTFIGEGGEVILKEVPLSEIIGEAELSKAVMLRHNNIGIDSQNYPELNMPARIKFTGVYALKDAYPLRNGEPCGDYCSDFKYDHRTGKASMDVSGFSNYSIGGINITYAEHLDSEYNLISDITADVKDKDNVWSEEIPVGHFVRAGFEENLTNGKLMDIYVRKGGADNVYFNVYEKGTTAPLLGASGPLAVEGGWVYIILENLEGEADTFDFKIMGDSGGYAEFDYIHDDDVSGCTNISYSGEYTLTQNLTGAPYALDFEYPFNVDNACIVIEASDVILDCSGYSINNDGTDNATAIAINGSTSGGLQNITIRNCPGINGYRTGFSSEHSSGIELGDSNFTNNTNGITIANTTYSRFTNLSIQDGGIHLYYGSDHNNITDLTSLDSGSYSVYLEESSYNRITRLFSGNASIHGIQMQDESLENLVHNSTINNSAGYGIQVANSTATLTNNIISVSGFSGLEIVGADVNASHNLIYDNTAGINARTFNAYEVQTYLVGYNNTLYDSSLAELYFEGDTNYTNINLTNTSILPSSGLYTTHSVIDIHDVVAPGKEYSVAWATGPASFGGYPDTYINASFKYKFLNITSDSAQAIDRLVWHWNSSEASGHQESKFRIVQNASSADRTIFPELPDTENRTFTLDSLQLYAQEDNFGIFEEKLNCIEPYNDLYINESTYLCEGWYNIADAGATGTVILNANNIEVVCPNNNVTINGTGAGVGFYILGGSGKGQNITLANCSAERYAEGIRVTATGGSVTRNKLIGNTILDCPIGIYLDNANNNNGNFVANNTIKRATSGIRLYREDNTVLANNDIRDSTYGFWLTDSSNYNLIASNYIQNMSEYGIRLRHSATGITNVDYNTFENNTIVDALYGIGFVPTGNAYVRYWNVTNNEINNTEYGIYISSNRATGNNFTENRINNATYGVFFESGFTTDTSQNYFQCENYYEGEKFCHFYDVHNAVFEDYYGSPGYVGNESNDATNLGMITIRDSSNFTFSNLNLSKDRNYGFASMYSDDIHVLDSIFSGNGATNAFLFGTKNNSFINTTFKDTEQGILLGHSSSIGSYAVTGTIISGSRIENASVYGIHFRHLVEDTLIDNNTFIDNPTHIAFVNANNYYSQISNNSFSGGDYGVFYNRIADTLYTYRYHNLTGNTAENISDTCYYIRSSGNGYHNYEYFRFERNNCTNATYGYYLQLRDRRTRFRHNVFDTANFQDVEYGLYIYLGVAQTASIPATTIENNTYSNFDINATVFPVTFWINSITSGVHKMEHALNNFTLRNDPESDFIENNRPAFTYINTTNITFHRNLGSISFPYLNFDATNSIRSTNTMLDSDIASIDSSVHTYFQAEANVSFYSKSCPAEIYWKDGFPTSAIIISATGSPCPGDRCYNEVCVDNIVNFTVSNFSGYTANVTGIPSVENVTLNSTFGTNYTSENLTVWYDITSPGGLPVKNITNWYVDGISLTNLNFPFVAYDDSVVQDYSPYSINGTPNNVFWNATMHNGRSGYYFNTSTSYIKIDDPGTGSPLDSDTFTLEVWANPDSTPASGLYELVSKIQVGGYSLGLATDGRAFMRVRTGGTYRYLYTNNDQVAAGDWHHIVGTYTHSTREANIYINGTLKATTIFASGTYGVNNHPVCIGAQTSSGGCLDGENFPGQISLFRFWNRTLTAEQVAALYTDYEANTIVSQETNVGEEWQACVTPNNGYLDGLTNCSNNLTILQLPPPIVENVTLNSTFGTNYTTENLTVYYDAYAVQGLPVKNITNWFVDGASIMYVNMPFENSGSSLYTMDYANGLNGTPVNSPTWGANYGYDGWGGYNFSVGNDYMNINNVAPSISGNPFTFTAWVMLLDTSSSEDQYILAANGAGTSTTNYMLFGSRASTRALTLYRTSYCNFGSFTFTVGKWHHVAFVVDPSNSRTFGYADGQYQGECGYTEIPSTARVSLAQEFDGSTISNEWGGRIDEVQFYSRLLTAEQIQMIYQNQTDSIHSAETKAGEEWQACITPNNGYLDGLTNCSNNITIRDLPMPIIENVTLNSTFGTNYTTENLTVYYDPYSPWGSEVKNITNWFVDDTSITVLNMPFEANGGDESSVAKDYSTYGNNGTVGAAASWVSDGGYDGWGAYSFNGGTNSFITIPADSSLNVGNTFTISAWVKPSSTSRMTIYSHGSNAASGFQLEMHGTCSGCGTGSFGTIISGVWVAYTGPGLIQNNEWNHIVYTRNGTGAGTHTLYLNGVQQTLVQNAANNYAAQSAVTLIGARTTTTQRFIGEIDELKVFSRPLSPEQVQMIYQNQTDSIHSAETKAGEEWQACITPNNGYLDGLTNCSNNITIRDLPMPIIENVTLNSTFGTNYTTENLTVYYDPYSPWGSEVKNITNWFVDDTSITVLNMPFEATGGNESTWTRDYSPYGNNGTVHGAVWGSDSGQDGWGAYEFTKASSQYISIPDDASFDITDEMSIEVRVKFKTKTTNQGIVYKGAFTNSWGPWALSYIQTASPNGIYFNINNFALTTITPDISVDTWYHIVATYDGQNMSIYMDGELEDANSFASPTQINTDSNPVRLGSYYGTSTNRYLDGSMDTVRIYNRALTPEQVQMLYHNQTDSISWNETEVGETWKACITPNDGNLPGLTNCSNNIIITQEPETCPVFSTPGVHELEMEAIGAKNTVSGITGITDACIVITSSDVILDCNGYNITNDGTGSAAGIFANTSATNITIRNCPKISGYSHGVSISNAGSGEIHNIVSENNQQGVVIQQSTGFTVRDSEIRGNSVRGVLFNNSGNIFLLNSHIYNNTYDLEVSEDAGTPSPFNATNVIFDRPEGDYNSFTNLSINDTAQSYAYTITWMDGLPPEPTGYVSFRQKYINISTSAGAPSINYISWHWTGAEIAGYNQSEFELWEYSSGGWSSLNNTPDIVAQALSLSGLSPSSGYGILQKNVTELTVYLNEPSNGHLTTSTTITFNCSAASPEPLVNITLYGNWSGGWHANETKPLSGTYDSASFTRTLPLGTYEWNCLAFDSTDNSDWADANYTFTILNATDDLYALHGANVTVLNTSKYNGSDVGGTYELQGGNLTGADFHMRVSTEKWAGMYGNLTAKIILSEGSDTVFMYAWNWTPEAGGEVCLTQNTGPFWTAMEPTQKSHIDTAFGYNPSDSDSANNTLTDASVLISVANTSSPTTGVHLGANSTFEMGAFQFIPNPTGEADFAFCVNLTDGVAYQNNSVHFELVVPTTEEKGPGPLETYYVYVELH